MDKEKMASKALIKIGSFVSGVGAVTITEGILTQRGEMGPTGVFIVGAGAVIIFTGIRHRKEK